MVKAKTLIIDISGRTYDTKPVDRSELWRARPNGIRISVVHRPAMKHVPKRQRAAHLSIKIGRLRSGLNKVPQFGVAASCFTTPRNCWVYGNRYLVYVINGGYTWRAPPCDISAGKIFLGTYCSCSMSNFRGIFRSTTSCSTIIVSDRVFMRKKLILCCIRWYFLAESCQLA
jgi:hypothetical protein